MGVSGLVLFPDPPERENCIVPRGSVHSLDSGAELNLAGRLGRPQIGIINVFHIGRGVVGGQRVEGDVRRVVLIRTIDRH